MNTITDKLAQALGNCIAWIDANRAPAERTGVETVGRAADVLAEYDAERTKSPRIVITMDGGLIQHIATDTPGVEMAVVDYDTDGADEDEVAEVAQLNESGDTEGYADAYLSERTVEHDPALVALRFAECAAHAKE